MNQNQKLLNSLSALSIMLEQAKKDYIELFLPFMKDIFQTRNYSEIDPHLIVNDFLEIHNLPIPYHAVISILNRCKKRKMIFIQNRKHHVARDLSQFEDLSSYEHDSAPLIQDLHGFLTAQFNPELTVEEVYKIFLAFLDDYSYQILLNYKKGVRFADIKLRKTEKNHIGKYIDQLIELNSPLAKELISLTVSSLVVNLITFENIENFEGKLKKVKIFIDTPVILKYIGVEGIEKENAFKELFSLIKSHGGEICIFKHTYEETMQILNDCQRYIEDDSYDPKLASPALKYFVAKEYTSAALSLFISKVNTKLNKEKIEYDIEVDPNEYVDHQINEEKLFKCIHDSYKNYNHVSENWKKRAVVLKDVKSISNIFRLRKGDSPVSLAGAKYIFLTTNSGLAFASFDFEKEEFEDYNIHACFTDVFLGTILWLQNPIQTKNINRLNLIAKCQDYLEPEERLIELFLEKIERLKNEDIISENEFYFLRTHKIVIEKLNERTSGDHENFYDKTPEEILEEIKTEARNETASEYEPFKAENEVLKKDLNNSTENLSNINSNIELIASRIGTAVSWFIVILLAIIVVLGFYFSENVPPSNWIVRLVIRIGGALIGILNILFGFNLLGLRKKLSDRIANTIKRTIRGA
ncbi:hypothetical protein [Salinispira pacifica]|uniref:Uncharacterized protein n=1 Tax=Salinispira pacifica TaxID=1307761 RepID=V5WI34_9SPIO|nr:hypothetical protein [Salinispira pacifica]AHC15453.1 hypothetical protein L21SP2_2086 [Salinispira pacifica]